MTEKETDQKSGEKTTGEARIWMISIGSSIFASMIFLLFFQPIMIWASNAMSIFLSTVSLATLKSIYRQAALGVSPAMEYMILVLPAFIISTTALASSVFIPMIRRRMIYLEQNKTPDEEQKEKSLEAHEEFCTFCNIALTVSSIAGFAMTALIALSLFICIQAEATFDQRLAIMAPGLNEIEEESFISRWHAMKSRADYASLMDDMGRVAKERNISVPESLI